MTTDREAAEPFLLEQIKKLEAERDNERAIVDRIWDMFGRPSYESLGGKSIYDLIAEVQEDAERYRWLRDSAHPDAPSGISISQEATNSWGKFYQKHLTGDQVDAAIDAARGKS